MFRRYLNNDNKDSEIDLFRHHNLSNTNNIIIIIIYNTYIALYNKL